MKTSSRASKRLVLKIALMGVTTAALYAGLLSCGSSDNNTPSATPVNPAVAPSASPTVSPSASPSPSPTITYVPVPPISPLPVGRWGGPHIELDARYQGGAKIKFECATGATDQMIEVDFNGDFEGAGTYTLNSGPIVLGQPRTFQAVYFGNVDGDEMKLTVQYTDTSGQLNSQDFELYYEQDPDFSQLCADIPASTF